jgi:hypothetical protein
MVTKQSKEKKIEQIAARKMMATVSWDRKEC